MPSTDVKARLQRYGMGERAIVVPHEALTTTDWPIADPEPPGPILRIALLGVLANHKGARAVAALAEAAAPGTIELHLIGHLEDSFPKQAVKLIKSTGPYRDTDVFDLLRQARPHVIWLPSSAPETYGYTLSTGHRDGTAHRCHQSGIVSRTSRRKTLFMAGRLSRIDAGLDGGV